MVGNYTICTLLIFDICIDSLAELLNQQYKHTILIFMMKQFQNGMTTEYHTGWNIKLFYMVFFMVEGLTD